MSRKKWYVVMAVAVVAAVTLGLVFGLTGKEPQGSQVIQASLPSAETPSEGIQIHGHWIIDVKNPDGRLASHNEFDNAITAEGRTSVIKLLMGEEVAGWWYIELVDPYPPCKYNGSPYACTLSEVDLGGTTQCDENTCAVFETLSHSYVPFHIEPPMKPVPASLQWKGSAVASYDGNISQVATSMVLCTSDSAPATCRPQGEILEELKFSETTLPEPISLVKDQQVIVEVDIQIT